MLANNRLFIELVEAESLELVAITFVSMDSALRVVKGIMVLQKVYFVVLVDEGSYELLFPINFLKEELVLFPNPPIFLLNQTSLNLYLPVPSHRIIQLAIELLILPLEPLNLFFRKYNFLREGTILVYQVLIFLIGRNNS